MNNAPQILAKRLACVKPLIKQIYEHYYFKIYVCLNKTN